MGALRFIEIPSQGSAASSEVFERTRSEMPAAGFASGGAVCSEQTLSVARYMAKTANLRIALVSNRQSGVVALQFTELGVSAFSPSAEEEYQALLSHLRARVANIREHLSDEDVPAFIERLYNRQRLVACA
jgi:hypothetical protein